MTTQHIKRETPNSQTATPKTLELENWQGSWKMWSWEWELEMS
jgi:hypothetical protein